MRVVCGEGDMVVKGERETACQPTESGSTNAPIWRGMVDGIGMMCDAGRTHASERPPPQPLRPTKPALWQTLSRDGVEVHAGHVES